MPQRNDPEKSTPVELDQIYTKVLGYLNFSGGKSDSSFLAQLDELAQHAGYADSWDALQVSLSENLAALQKNNETFTDSNQAQAVIAITFDELLPAYHEFHAHLLFGLPSSEHLNPFFLGRLFESVLEQGGPWSESERIVAGALDSLNDYMGYRPLAMLENGRKMTPYDHERFRPLPLYVAGAGVCSGPHKEVLEQGLAMLRSVPSSVLAGAHFDLNHMDELALDVRAYDHDHPVFKRTNYLFGEWDPLLIDNSGFYRRFIIRKIILDALVDWVTTQKNHEEAVFDAGAVLCGTILMASSISGDGPSCHDSEVTLTSLLPIVARQRDDFYARLMSSVDGPRARRLAKEAKLTQQPFGHVRQSLNLYLAHYGARQVQYRQLSNIYARMGHSEAARKQADIIPANALRFECEVQWRITSVGGHLKVGNVEAADNLMQEIETLLHDGTECGAFVDPWNILGFQGNFPLFWAREDSIPDQRVEVLLDLMERIFGIYSRLLSEAAAQGKQTLLTNATARFETLADYWDQFAAHVIDDLPKVFGRESLESARHVAEALAEWRAAGEAAGDITFWRKHVGRFTSAKSYACVVEALLAREDNVAAMALLVQWLSVSDEVGIESGPYSIHALLLEWMNRISHRQDADENPTDTPPEADWVMIRRLFDFLEANAGGYWNVPVLGALAAGLPDPNHDGRRLEDWDVERGEDWLNSDDEENPYEAAYEGVVFRDSTDDGIDEEVLDGGSAPGNTEFEMLNRELEPRIKFIMALAQLWQSAVSALSPKSVSSDDAAAASLLTAEQLDVVAAWRNRVAQLQEDLLSLLNSVWEHEIDEPGGDHDANIEYDIQLQTKFYLVNTIIATHINCRVSEVGLQCLLPSTESDEESGKEEDQMIEFYRAVIRRDVAQVRQRLAAQFRRLSRKPLLYVPLDNGGHPMQILAARTVQTDIRFLLQQLPRLGLLRETWHVVRLAHRMERETRPTEMAVTEFDRIFRTALRNTIDCVLDASKSWSGGAYSDEDLISLIGDILAHYRDQWYRHSRTMRLSAVEGLRHDLIWDDVKQFVETFGDEMFHARSLTLGNVRTILHNGVEWFLEQLAEYEDPLHPSPLLTALDERLIEVDDVVETLELIYGSVVDKFDRFLEYNTTTTQSDYGDKFYVLLDFLRVEAEYDRDAWERIPEGIVHRSLAMAGQLSAISILEDILEADSREDADKRIDELTELEQKYGVHLPAVSDRINERFIKPLAINRILSHIEPAMKTTPEDVEADTRFSTLYSEIENYMQDQAGSAIDIPHWLQDIDREVNRLEAPADYIRPPELEVRIPSVPISEQEVRAQLAVWGQAVAEVSRTRRRKQSRRGKRKDNE